MAAAKEISMGAAIAAVLSPLDGTEGLSRWTMFFLFPQTGIGKSSLPASHGVVMHG